MNETPAQHGERLARETIAEMAPTIQALAVTRQIRERCRPASPARPVLRLIKGGREDA